MKAYQLIAALAAQHGLTSSGLAKALKRPTSQGQIHRYLHGHVKTPTAPTAMGMATLFNLPLEAIFDDALATKIAKERGIVALPEREPKKRKTSEDAALDAQVLQTLAELPTPAMRRRAANLFVIVCQAVAAGREAELIRPVPAKRPTKSSAAPKTVR